jgi:outer membrane murein-binding lipoprotein Lpp
MKQLIISTILLWGLGFSPVKADDLSKEVTSLKTEIATLKTKQESLKNDISAITVKNQKAEGRISNLESKNKDLVSKIDSLQEECAKLTATQKTDRNDFRSSIDQTNEKVQSAEQILSSRTLWGVIGILVLLCALIGIVVAFLKKFKSGSTSIASVRKAQTSLEEAQESIRKAQEKMEEETIQLDNKLIEVLSKQSVISLPTTDNGEMDHSLTLKVADEITKIEMNLSRMDESIKGYKQLSKGVQRIKDNFRANDYEIVDMLGKPYKQGMKAAVTFVTDENLEPGQQIISRIIKPQVNYKQKMIQAAQIEVSQAE